MSSLGGQWRVLRHYLSASNLHMELEKLVQRLRPASPAQWDYVIKKFERVVSTRLSQATEEVKLNKDSSVKNVTVQQTAAAERTPRDTMPAEKREETERSSGSVKPVGPSVGLEEREITIESLLQGLRLRKDLHFGKISEPGWKDNKPLVTKACVAKRTEDFIEHINQYPEARDLAIKEGAVRALLRVQDRIRDESSAAREVNGIVDEALALVGYCAPTHGPGPSVLSLDGGGIRGLIAIEVLRHLERLTGRRVDELFDYIIGVSTGAIIAAVIGLSQSHAHTPPHARSHSLTLLCSAGGGVGNLETASKLYHTLSKEMFGDTSLIGGEH
ncbi:Phospholipase [Operophtera brumata]|uniref:Phospholipase n=1 Tax=Operophtera brumata TaxID=104452 RepID=A0A0L7LIG5_OPEBR|nr:Phospholipase [Operophtera brumata]